MDRWTRSPLLSGSVPDVMKNPFSECPYCGSDALSSQPVVRDPDTDAGWKYNDNPCWPIDTPAVLFEAKCQKPLNGARMAAVWLSEHAERNGVEGLLVGPLTIIEGSASGYHYRTFAAIRSFSDLQEALRERPEAFEIHEHIGSGLPVKFVLDFDARVYDGDEDELGRVYDVLCRCIADVCTRALDGTGVSISVNKDLVVLNGSRPICDDGDGGGYKFSFHIIVCPPGRDTRIPLLRSSTDGALLAEEIRDMVREQLSDRWASAIDMGIYCRSHTLRSVGSPKLECPSHPFCKIAPPGMVFKPSAIDKERFITDRLDPRAWVTAVPIDTGRRAFYRVSASSASSSASPSISSSIPSPPHPPPPSSHGEGAPPQIKQASDIIEDLIRRMSGNTSTHLRWVRAVGVADAGTWFVNSARFHVCPAGRTHKKQTSFFVVKEGDEIIWRCHDTASCGNSRCRLAVWNNLSECWVPLS